MTSTLLKRVRPLKAVVRAQIPTSESLFFPLTHYHHSPNQSITVGATAANDPDRVPTAFDLAMARLEALERQLPRDMVANIKAVLAVVHTHLSSTAPHHFISLIASGGTTDDTIGDIAKTIDDGLTAFLARGRYSAPVTAQAATQVPEGPSATSEAAASEVGSRTADVVASTPLLPDLLASTPELSEAHPAKRRKKSSTSSSRSKKVKNLCKERDGEICCVTNQEENGLVSHIIPHSVQGSTAIDFWKLISLFRGDTETMELRDAALGPGSTTDVLLNVWWIWDGLHTVFDKGHIAIVPDLIPSQFPYDPDKITEYQATVEFPMGLRKIALPIIVRYSPGPTESRPTLIKFLEPGDRIILRTSDATRLPLPHPALFQLHTICSRVLAAKAQAGYSHLDRFADGGAECILEEASEDEEEEESGDDDDVVSEYDDVNGWLCSNAAAGLQPFDPSAPPNDPEPSFYQERSNTHPPPAVDSFRECDGENDDDEAEKSRYVNVVRKELGGRMNDMWKKARERLGREPAGRRWWDGRATE